MDTTLQTNIEVQYKHTEGQVMYELMACLGDDGPHMNMRQYILMHQLNLDIDSKASRENLKGIDPENAKEEMEAIMRVFEIMAEGIDHTTPTSGRSSDYPIHGPEWMCDVVSKAAHALPSLTWDDAMSMPLVRLLHLAAAGGRMEGMVTRRPIDLDKAWKEFVAWDDERLSNEGQD